MANTNAPFGFKQYQGTGSAPTYEQVTMTISKNYSTPIYFGDPVQPVTGAATGYIQIYNPADTVATSGVLAGVKYLSTSQKRIVWSNYWPGSDASQDVEAYVINDPNAKFLVQAGGTNVGFDKIGQNIDVNMGSGNTASGISGAYVESPGTAATLPFRVVDVVATPPGANGTDITAAYNLVIVQFNDSLARANGAQTGIS